MGGPSNTYLEQVVSQQAELEDGLRTKGASAGPLAKRNRALGGEGGPATAAPAAVDVRITGFARWKNVLVPPNAFVVHTRRGRTEPLHIGLGVSFRYNPATDSFLVVPGATQTILINAYCICGELQGVLVQGYVQWIIQDFATAYRKLDFSDTADPMRVVNLQLKEQAEAAIKDKVSTMGVRDVLSDKQPIIEELTARLSAVAEGGDGLGLRIVTVQIKEAVVSSSTLWENLQKPYRADQAQTARLAELQAEEAVAQREMAATRNKELQRITHERELAELRARNEAERFNTESAETERRSTRDHEVARTMAEIEKETTLHALRLERERHTEETETGRLRISREEELKRLALDGELARTKSRADAAHDGYLLEIERLRSRTEIANTQSPANLQAQLVKSLPEIVAKLPKPDELRTVNIGGGDTGTLAGLVAELGAVIGALRTAVGDKGRAGD